MATKTRTFTKEEEYDICNLCREEITANFGNTIVVGNGDAEAVGTTPEKAAAQLWLA